MMAMLPGGIEITYDDTGTGFPLLFIHGWPHNRTLWAAQLTGLCTQARCIAPDLRGFGDSTVSPPFSIDQFADDLVGLLDVIGVESAVVCGLSMGGYVALSMLRRHRSRIRALILASTRATADTDDARAKRVRLIEFVRARGVDALAGRQLKAMVGATSFASRPNMLEALRHLMASAPLNGVVGGLEAMASRADSTDLLPHIDMPVLVISGAEDTFTPPDEMRALAASIPCARLEVLDRTGHVNAYEGPAAFNHVVAEFLLSLVYD